MKTAIQLNIEMHGVTKRARDLREIIFSIEKQNHTRSSSVITEDNCVALFYSWGHIILYTYPKSRFLSVTLFSTQCRIKTDMIKKAMIQVLKPSHYDVEETTRMVG